MGSTIYQRKRIKLYPQESTLSIESVVNSRNYRRLRIRRLLTRRKTPITNMLFCLLLLTIQPSTILFVHGVLCTRLEPETLSSLYEILSLTTTRTATLCPFQIEGDRCDMDEPYVLDSSFTRRSKVLRCDRSGSCSIDCNMDSHFIVKDGKELVLESMMLQGAKKGSVHVIKSTFRSIGSTWRE